MFLIVSAYVWTIGWGPASAYSMSNYLVPLTITANKLVGTAAAVLITFFFLESFYNVELSFFTSTVRYFYGIARDDLIIPAWFAKVDEKSHVPRRALILIVILSFPITLISGLLFGTFNGYVELAVGITVFALTVYIITNLTVGFLFRRLNEFNIIWHVVLPVISAALMVYVIYGTIYPFTYPYTYMTIIALIWAIIAAVLTLYIRKIKPEKYKVAGIYTSVED